MEGTEWAFCSELCRDAHQVEHELSVLNILDEIGHRVRSIGHRVRSIEISFELPEGVDLELDDEESGG